MWSKVPLLTVRYIVRTRYEIGTKQTSTDCRRIADVESLTFHRCRAGSPRGQYFTLNECPASRVINIQSAELGYSESYNPTVNPPRCPWRNCTRSTDEPATV